MYSTIHALRAVLFGPCEECTRAHGTQLPARTPAVTEPTETSISIVGLVFAQQLAGNVEAGNNKAAFYGSLATLAEDAECAFLYWARGIADSRRLTIIVGWKRAAGENSKAAGSASTTLAKAINALRPFVASAPTVTSVTLKPGLKPTDLSQHPYDLLLFHLPQPDNSAELRRRIHALDTALHDPCDLPAHDAKDGRGPALRCPASCRRGWATQTASPASTLHNAVEQRTSHLWLMRHIDADTVDSVATDPEWRRDCTLHSSPAFRMEGWPDGLSGRSNSALGEIAKLRDVEGVEQSVVRLGRLERYAVEPHQQRAKGRGGDASAGGGAGWEKGEAVADPASVPNKM